MGENESGTVSVNGNNASFLYTHFVLDNSTDQPMISLGDNRGSTLETEKIQDLVYLIMYSCTCAVALFGNLIVCKVVFGKPSMMTFTNLLLANMAFSDILCALMFPIGLVVCCDQFIGTCGNYGCLTAKAIQLTSFQVSSITITVVAIDRFMLVHFPIIRSHRIVPVWVVMICVWMLALLIIVGTSPSLAFHRYFSQSDAYIKCEVALVFAAHVLSPLEQRVILVIANLAHFWIPLIVIIICYGSITCKVSKRNVGHMTQSQQEIILRTKWKTIKMLIAAVAVHFLCWFPFFILNLIDFFGHPERKRPCNKSGLFFIAVWIAFTSCCCNPFVYWIYSKDFREGLKQIARLARSSIASRPSLISYISSIREVNKSQNPQLQQSNNDNTQVPRHD